MGRCGGKTSKSNWVASISLLAWMKYRVGGKEEVKGWSRGCSTGNIATAFPRGVGYGIVPSASQQHLSRV